jgi:hypothetical protein
VYQTNLVLSKILGLSRTRGTINERRILCPSVLLGGGGGFEWSTSKAIIADGLWNMDVSKDWMDPPRRHTYERQRPLNKMADCWAMMTSSHSSQHHFYSGTCHSLPVSRSHSIHLQHNNGGSFKNRIVSSLLMGLMAHYLRLGRLRVLP